MSIELYPHQRGVIKKMHNGCVLAGGVGTGKTLTALAYYTEVVCGGVLDRSEPMRHPKDLVIITTAKKRDSLDWESEAIKLGIFVDEDNSYSSMEFIVDSWNNIKNYVDYEDAFFVFDEQRLVGTGVWVKSFLKIAKKNQWIMLSATPADTWLDYIPLLWPKDTIETGQTLSTTTWSGLFMVSIGKSGDSLAFVIWNEFDPRSLLRCRMNDTLHDIWLKEELPSIVTPSIWFGIVDGMSMREYLSSMWPKSTELVDE